MAEAATLVECLMPIPKALKRLNVIATGTCVPDILSSVALLCEGKANTTAGNALGSNAFIIMVCIGLPYLIKGPMQRAVVITAVHPITALAIPIINLFTFILVLIAALMSCKWTLGPPLGIVLFCINGLLLAYSLLELIGGIQICQLNGELS